MDVRGLVEAELARRGFTFAIDLRTKRLIVKTDEDAFVLSLDNLERIYALNPSPNSVLWFLDAALAPAAEISTDGLIWLLEPNDYEHRAHFIASISPRLDRVLAHAAPDGSRIGWIRPADLDALGIDLVRASDQAFSNLDRELRQAKLTTDDRSPLPVLMIITNFPSKASLLLAPSLRESVSPHIGWPVLAVAPDRDFVLLWNAKHEDLIQRFGPVVLRENRRAPYPLSVEVFRIDETLRAVGELRQS